MLLILLSLCSLAACVRNATFSDEPDYNFGRLTFYDTNFDYWNNFYLLNFGSEHNSANSNNTNAMVNDFNFMKYTNQQFFSYKNGTSNLIYHFNQSFAQLIHDFDLDNIQFYGDQAIVFTINNTLGINSLEFLNLNNFKQATIFNSSSVTGVYVHNGTAYFTYDNMIGSWNGSRLKENFLEFNNDSHVENVKMINSTNMLISGQFNSITNISAENTNTTVYDGLPVTLYEANWQSTGNIEPSNLICPSDDYTDNAWSINNSTRGEFIIDLKYDITPTKLRFYNSEDLDSAVSLFRVVTYPAGGIMNMTYLDSSTNKLATCDAFCPLYSLSTLQNISSTDPVSIDSTNLTSIANTKKYQEFAFASPVSVASFEFIAMDSFGDNVALRAIEVYSNSFTIFANDTYNHGSCKESKTYVSSRLSDSNWTLGDSNDTYISTNYIPGDSSVPKVTYNIDIENAGEYSIHLYTPGCSADNTCNSRGIANITIYDSKTNEVIQSTLVYQNNDFLKYDSLFEGHLNNSISIELTYSSGLYSDNTVTTVVADRIDVQITSIDQVQDNNNIVLNGLLTIPFDTRVIDVSDNINQLAANVFEYDSTLLSTIVNDTLLITDKSNTLIIMSLNDTNNFYNMTINGNIIQLGDYSNGVCVLTDSDSFFLYYDDNLHRVDNDNNASLTSVHNITINNLEYLVFNDNYIYNLTSSMFLTQDDQISYLVMNSGHYNGIGTIFSGDIAFNQFTNLNASIELDPQNGYVQSIDCNPYDGVFFNDTLSGFFQYDSDAKKTKLYWNNSQYSGLQWDNNVTSTLYDNDSSLLFVGFNSSIIMVNMTTMKIINEIGVSTGKSSTKNNASVNSMIYLPQNKSVVVSGSYLNQDCSTVCLYNYQKSDWNPINSDNITGTIKNSYLYKNDTILLQGNVTINDKSNVQLFWFNMTSNKTSVIISDDTANHITLSGVHVYDDVIVGWNNTMVLTYADSNNTWSLHPIAQINSNSIVNTVEIIKMNNGKPGLMVAGELFDGSFGLLQGVVYDFNDWSPFFYTSGEYHPTQSKLFMNRDVSSWQIAQSPFSTDDDKNGTNSNSTSTPTGKGNNTSSSEGTSITDNNQEVGKHRIKKGYIILIGLALSLATISVLGLLGVLIAYVFKDGNSTNYQTMNPMIDENKMVETLPPEKIMEFM